MSGFFVGRPEPDQFVERIHRGRLTEGKAPKVVYRHLCGFTTTKATAAFIHSVDMGACARQSRKGS